MNVQFLRSSLGHTLLCLSALALLISLHGKVSADFVTGFEAPTYTSGALVPQDSWGGGTAPRVQTDSEIAAELTNAGLDPAAAVHGGTQAVIVTGTGSSSSTVRPVSGLSNASKAVLDVWARPLTPGSTTGSTIGSNVGNIFMTMENSSGVRAAAFRFGATADMGQITSTSIDYYSEGSAWIPTGLTWQPDTWYNVRLVADYVAKTYSVAIDGTEVASSATFYNTTSSELSQIRIFRGSGQAGMIVDDVAVIPEPSTIAISLLAGSVLLVGRSRRSK